ncbi:MAG: hypothetical protein IRY99_25120 [Isosphaeraceae bacterium]|nr:hypothetical protein [Isosphaeraceae bacterium]
MARRKPSPKDAVVRQLHEALKRHYQPAHSAAKIAVKRYNSASVRVRIIDPDFEGQSLTARDDAIWEILDRLPDEVRSEIGLLLLLTPREAETSLMNLEFEKPAASPL